MSICGECGAEVAAGAAYCGRCGTRVAAAAAPPRSAGIFHYVPHPHIENRKKRVHAKPPEQPKAQGPVNRFNAFLAVKITNGVGTMWCAYLFAGIALISLPEAIKGGTSPLIAWIAQTFLQLVLLSIIIVGQKVESAASETRAIETYNDAEAILHEAMGIQKHLLAQDAFLQKLIEAYGPSQPLPQEGAEDPGVVGRP